MIRKWLIDIRKEKGKTQLETSRNAKITEAYYCQLEKNKRSPSVSVAKRISKYLKFDWQKFFEDIKE